MFTVNVDSERLAEMAEDEPDQFCCPPDVTITEWNESGDELDENGIPYL